MPTSPSRRVRRILIVAAGVVALAVVVLGMFPWGALAGLATGPLSRAAGREVSIGSARRLDWFSFTPTIELRDVTVAQPAWAGAGAMAWIGRARLRLPIFPLLAGHVRPRALDVDGVRLALRRDARGRANWEGPRRPGDRHDTPGIERLTIANGRLTLVDVRRHVALSAAFSSDPGHGFLVAGRGTDRGRPMTLAFRGGALDWADPDASYPIRLAVSSPLTRFDAEGRLDRPLDLSAMTVTVHASGRDLSYLDDYVQAGLFPTTDYDLAGLLRRDGDRWRSTGLSGRIGRSRLVAALDVTTGARTRIDGQVVASALDFSDFQSDAQRARGRAEAAATGPRVLPNTRIVLAKLGRIDATVRLQAARLLGDASSPFRSLRTVATLSDRRLMLAPLRVGLRSGTMTGSVRVDDRGRTSRLTLDLAVSGATVEGLFVKERVVSGPFSARIDLTGVGDTFRAAVADANGAIGFAVSSGTIRRDDATYLGGDVLRSAGAAIAGGDDRVGLRCLVGNFPVRGGVMTADPLVLDDTLSRGDGSGRITLADERLDLSIDGRPKQPGPLVSIAPIRISGTLSNPRIDVGSSGAAADARNTTIDRIGVFLKQVRPGNTARGRDVAPNADCGALVRKAVG